jgi:hypothetical protein
MHGIGPEIRHSYRIQGSLPLLQEYSIAAILSEVAQVYKRTSFCRTISEQFKPGLRTKLQTELSNVLVSTKGRHSLVLG